MCHRVSQSGSTGVLVGLPPFPENNTGLSIYLSFFRINNIGINHHFYRPGGNPRYRGLRFPSYTLPHRFGYPGADQSGEKATQKSNHRSQRHKTKLERIARLEEKELKSQNSDLASTSSLLREQVSQLKQKAMSHFICTCKIATSKSILGAKGVVGDSQDICPPGFGMQLPTFMPDCRCMLSCSSAAGC
ncbi:transcription factor AP-1-like [Xenopus laevis]|uniref:Transcription factor AP-1-like n=1 Tax=Xenopus laevis TaxID=8355 RepID=A0A8J0TIF5_XENLA|nr:transcription factor AP-1-like [Xenopus laevis]